MKLIQSKGARVAGRYMVRTVALVLILAGGLKLAGLGAEDMVEGLKKAQLIQHLTLISVTAVVCGSLLLIPGTRTLGLLMSSAYWGGAIVAHLTYNDSVVMPAGFLAVLWIGHWLSAQSGTVATEDDTAE
ncbi:MAG TPA: hypothetical protein EYG03_19565 [Planctomycetes bacterium]|nr:hypothetical protein [Fuerstiella sp.]HIK94148.1 hypothetical protein [Planctomycetota bacterium]